MGMTFLVLCSYANFQKYQFLVSQLDGTGHGQHNIGNLVAFSQLPLHFAFLFHVKLSFLNINDIAIIISGVVGRQHKEKCTKLYVKHPTNSHHNIFQNHNFEEYFVCQKSLIHPKNIPFSNNVIKNKAILNWKMKDV